jgi:hypothetical protein
MGNNPIAKANGAAINEAAPFTLDASNNGSKNRKVFFENNQMPCCYPPLKRCYFRLFSEDRGPLENRRNRPKIRPTNFPILTKREGLPY